MYSVWDGQRAMTRLGVDPAAAAARERGLVAVGRAARLARGSVKLAGVRLEG